MTNLSFRQGDERWLALRERCRDLFFFNEVVLGYTNLFAMEPETHLLFHRFMERKTGSELIDSAPMQLVMMPRGTGKTTCGTRGHAIQMACFNPDISILIANEVQETANAFLKEIQQQFEQNELLQRLFPEVIPDFHRTTWAAEAATLRRSRSRPEPTFMTIGVGGTRTGLHFDVILGDDLVSKEAMEAARIGAWNIMDKAKRWVNQLKPLLNPQFQPFPWIRVIGTNWWREDVYDYIEGKIADQEPFTYGEMRQRVRLSAKLPSGAVVSHDVWRAGDLAVFKMRAEENGKPVFPKIYDEDELAHLRSRDPELYACNYLNDPTDAAVRTFQDEWLRYYNWTDPQTVSFRNDDGSTKHLLISDLSKVLVVDPAFTSTGQGARSALVVVGTDLETGKHLVLDAIAERVDPKDLVTDILNLAQRRGVQRVFVEAVAQQLGFIQFLQTEAQTRNQPVSIETVKPGGRAKDIRIEGLSAHFKAGTILLDPKMLNLLRELSSFRPGARLKDLLDALAYASEVWVNVGRPNQRGDAKSRQRAELDAYYARRTGRPAAPQYQPMQDKEF